MPGDTQAHVQVHSARNFDHFMFATDATGADGINLPLRWPHQKTRDPQHQHRTNKKKRKSYWMTGGDAFVPTSMTSSLPRGQAGHGERAHIDIMPYSAAIVAAVYTASIMRTTTSSSPMTTKAGRVTTMKPHTRGLNSCANISPTYWNKASLALQRI